MYIHANCTLHFMVFAGNGIQIALDSRKVTRNMQQGNISLQTCTSFKHVPSCRVIAYACAYWVRSIPRDRSTEVSTDNHSLGMGYTNVYIEETNEQKTQFKQTVIDNVEISHMQTHPIHSCLTRGLWMVSWRFQSMSWWILAVIQEDYSCFLKLPEFVITLL